MTLVEARPEKLVFGFEEGDRHMKNLLGGKGANLAEMTRLGIPVPPGFTITTAACQRYLASGRQPSELSGQINDQLRLLEDAAGRRLGDPIDPLLVSVRSGSVFSMPGMMDTVLNIGLNDLSVRGLAEQSGDPRFAWDSYRRLIQMFGRTVFHLDPELFEAALARAKTRRGVSNDSELDAGSLKELVDEYKALVATGGREFPQDPRAQLDLAIDAVFGSWNSERARLYRRQERIPDDLGTAVNVVAMVFGNLGETSGTGVAFTRDPSTGAAGTYGDYLQNAQGEDVVSGSRNTIPLDQLEQLDKVSYDELMRVATQLERHYLDLCDIEFTIERGKLWLLQTRVGKRTPEAAFRIANTLVQEGLIDRDTALSRVTGGQLSQLMFPRFADVKQAPSFTQGIGASPGAATGRVAFTSARAEELARAGEDVILVRRETNPDDLQGMIAAVGILTSRGGKTSHAAVVARGMGRTCVCGAEQLIVTEDSATAGEVVLREGDVISIDGTTGEVFLGALPVVDSPLVRYLEGEIVPEAAGDPLVAAVHEMLVHADSCRRLEVRANADNESDAARARRFGAAGIGLCRTEHMFLGDRSKLVERLILSSDPENQQAVLDALLPLQREDFEQVLLAMDDLPTTIRLIDPPLHEFLPALDALRAEVAVDRALGRESQERTSLLEAVHRLHEQNPILGLRGVRLGLVIPGLIRMQARAIAESVVTLTRAGHRPRPEIMIPFVGAAAELELARAEVECVIRETELEFGIELRIPVGTMIELPRAALTAGQIAESADFFSFGTNDLTQTTWGFSRDDLEASLFQTYLDRGIFRRSPFESIDVAGVGRLVSMASAAGRASRPGLKMGACGEHAGDPDSIHFFEEIGLDYVSCSPFRVPVARLEAGRSTLRLARSSSA